MAKPKRQEQSQVANVRKVRGVPITDLSRRSLEAELIKALQSVDNLQETIRLHHIMWREAMGHGGLPEAALAGIARRMY